MSNKENTLKYCFMQSYGLSDNNRDLVPSTENLSDALAQKPPSVVLGKRNLYNRDLSGLRCKVPKPNVGVTQNRGPPTPECLSTSNTILRNDPLDDETYMDPSFEMRERGAIRTLTPEATGLPALVEASYRIILSDNHDFARNVSLSAYNYYVTQILLARLLRVNEMNSFGISDDARQFARHIEHGNYGLPKLLAMYINGFGNVTLPSGREIKLRLPHNFFDVLTHQLDYDDIYLIGGFFGNIKDNPDLYAHLPCPGLAAQRIVSDLRAVGNWDLPDVYKIPGHQINHRTIGYAPTVPLTPQMVSFLADCRITHDQFETVVDRFSFNPYLMKYISTMLNATPHLNLFPVNMLTINGSLGQVITSVPVHVSITPGSSTYIATSPYRIPSAISYLASTFLYRTRQIPHHLIAPVDFYHHGLNYIYEKLEQYHDLDAKPLSYDEYSTVQFIPRDRLLDMAYRDLTYS